MSRHQPHTDDVLDPVIADELRRLEAALAGSPSADAELLALVDAVRADVPAPRPAFRHELDARAAAGFRAGGGPGAWMTAARTWMANLHIGLMPVLGLAATVLIALVVVAGALKGGRTADHGAAAPREQFAPATTSQGKATGAPARQAASPAAASKGAPGPAAQDSAGSAIGAVPPGPSPAPAATNSTVPRKVVRTTRKVVRTTELSLRTAARRLQAVADGIVRVTQAAGGVVEQSNVDGTDRGGTASFTLSVPTGRADETVKRLSALAHVASMSQASTDITGSFVSAADRLSDARAERGALRKALDAARTPEGIARLRDRIARNRAQIAALKGEVASLRRRADNTSLSVNLTARGGTPAPKHGATGGGWSPGDAAGDALRVLEVSAGVLLIALAVALPLGLITVPAIFGARVARRRRREQALDAV